MASHLLFLLFLLSEAASEPVVVRVVQVKLGQDVILPCHTDVITITAADWIRSEPEPPTDILFWTDGHITSPIKDRVQLVDGELKTGDVSLILKDVKREDSGTYECRVKTAGSRHKKTETISIVKLLVTDPEPVVIVEQVGQDVILPCRAGDVTITAAEWTRSDLEDPNYVLFHRDGPSDPKHQHSSFTGRVQLVDGELKTGDVSMILKNVKREDSGTYECRVKTAGSRRKKRAVKTDPISRVQLQVTDPENNKGDNKDGHNGDTDNRNSPRLYVGLGAAGVFLLVCSGLVMKSKRQREKKPEPSADEETGDNLL